MIREETLTRLAQSRQALHQAIQGLSEEEMTQVQVEGTWTIKDVLGHIASWEMIFVQPLQRHADGGPVQAEVIKDYLAWNDEQATAKQHLPLDVVLDELTAIRQGLVVEAQRLSAEQWEQRIPFPWGGEGTAIEALSGLSGHEMAHGQTIQQWRAEYIRSAN